MLTLDIKSKKEEEVLSLALVESFSNSKILRQDELDVLIRTYHRLKGNEDMYYADEQ